MSRRKWRDPLARKPGESVADWRQRIDAALPALERRVAEARARRGLSPVGDVEPVELDEQEQQ